MLVRAALMYGLGTVAPTKRQEVQLKMFRCSEWTEIEITVRNRGRPQRSFMHVVTEEMQRVSVTWEDARDRVR